MTPAEFTKELEQRVNKREFSNVGEVVLYAQSAGYKVSKLSWTANTAMPAWKDQLFAKAADQLLILPTRAKLHELAALAHTSGYWPSGMTLVAAVAQQNRAQEARPQMLLAGDKPSAGNGQPIVVHVHPVVNVSAPAAPDVHVHVPAQERPVVHVHAKPPDVNIVNAPPPPGDVDIERNRDGSIKRISRKKQSDSGPRGLEAITSSTKGVETDGHQHP